MKHIKKFNENKASDIESISFTLIMEIFDEYNIFYSKTGPEDLNSKYWRFLNDDTIRIGNIDSEEYTSIINDLHYIRYMIRIRTGLEYDLKYSSAFSKGYLDLEIVK